MPKILLVDDREDNLLSIETILEQDNYEFVKATSGRQALKILLGEYDFALILMDVNMPNFNGFETAALIREREKLKHIPIIFITANSYGDDNMFQGYKAGAVDYIFKPINPDLLRAKVSVFIELYRKNHALLAQEERLISINKSLQNEITERKNSEEKVKALNLQLLQNIDKLESANKDLDRFAFMASHDLQEPLRKIRTFSDMLTRKYSQVMDADGYEIIKKIEGAAQRMSNLIQDILTFSKISAEKKNFVTSDLNVLIKDVLNDMNASVAEKHAQIFVDTLPSLSVNPVLIRPLFYNIISNSLKYSKQGTPPIIKIHAESNGTPDKKFMRIYFEDNGIGFEQKYAEDIFTMFNRLPHPYPVEGTGIGLALCKKIVEVHNGYISAKSKVDEGATFIISLPVKAELEASLKTAHKTVA
jgi:signal transduction histidine kinase